MFYKITDPEREDFKKFKELREKELAMEARNNEEVKKRVGDYIAVYDHHGQQNVVRVTQFKGFIFAPGHQPDTNMLRPSKDGIWVPNRRTKRGRELEEFLLNGIEKSIFHAPYEILGLEVPMGVQFTFPYVEAFDTVVILTFGPHKAIKREGFTEITKTEFDQILQSEWDKKIAKQLQSS